MAPLLAVGASEPVVVGTGARRVGKGAEGPLHADIEESFVGDVAAVDVAGLARLLGDGGGARHQLALVTMAETSLVVAELERGPPVLGMRRVSSGIASRLAPPPATPRGQPPGHGCRMRPHTHHNCGPASGWDRWRCKRQGIEGAGALEVLSLGENRGPHRGVEGAASQCRGAVRDSAQDRRRCPDVGEVDTPQFNLVPKPYVAELRRFRPPSVARARSAADRPISAAGKSQAGIRQSSRAVASTCTAG